LTWKGPQREQGVVGGCRTVGASRARESTSLSIVIEAATTISLEGWYYFLPMRAWKAYDQPARGESRRQAIPVVQEQRTSGTRNSATFQRQRLDDARLQVRAKYRHMERATHAAVLPSPLHGR
jgi:hypothetical protein